MPSSRAMLPATQSITSVKEVRAIDFRIQLAECGWIRQRQIGIDRPDHLLHFFHEGRGASAGSANDECNIAVDGFLLPFETILKHRPVHGGGRWVVDAIVMHVPGNTNDFAPIVGGAHADLLAEGDGRDCATTPLRDSPRRSRRASSGRFPPRSDRGRQSAEFPWLRDSPAR